MSLQDQTIEPVFWNQVAVGQMESVGILIPLTNKWFVWQEKYPDVVSLPEGCRSELMIIRSPQLPGISMTIFWKIDVSMEGVVKPSLELLLKMADQAREFDGLFSEPPAGSWGGSIYRGLDKNCVCEKSKIKPKFTLWELHI